MQTLKKKEFGFIRFINYGNVLNIKTLFMNSFRHHVQTLSIQMGVSEANQKVRKSCDAIDLLLKPIIFKLDVTQYTEAVNWFVIVM